MIEIGSNFLRTYQKFIFRLIISSLVIKNSIKYWNYKSCSRRFITDLQKQARLVQGTHNWLKAVDSKNKNSKVLSSKVWKVSNAFPTPSPCWWKEGKNNLIRYADGLSRKRNRDYSSKIIMSSLLKEFAHLSKRQNI